MSLLICTADGTRFWHLRHDATLDMLSRVSVSAQDTDTVSQTLETLEAGSQHQAPGRATYEFRGDTV